jgi:tetratricopeptide (TPR) repeat protein
VDTTTGQSVRIEGPIVASRPTLDDAVEQISKRLMSSVAWHLDEFFLLSLAEPPDWDTYLFFIEGLRSGMLPSEREKHLNEVLEIDPRFIPARLLLALTYSNAGRRSEEKELLADLEQDSAKMSRYGREDLSLRRSDLEGDWLKCLDSVRRMQDLKPQVELRPQLIYYLNLSNRMLELAEFSSGLLDKFGEKPPPLFLLHKSSALHMLSRHDEELEIARKGRDLYPNEIGFWSTEAGALSALGRFDELLSLLDDSTTIATQEESPISTGQQDPGTVFEAATEELRVHGRRQESLDVANRLVEWRKHAEVDGTAAWDQRVRLAYAFYLAERWEEARSLLEELAVDVVNLDDRYVMSIHGLSGVIAARQGDRQRAQRISRDLEEITERSPGERADWRAQIAAQLGERESALHLLRQAVAEGRSVPGNIHWKPAYEPLWDDPEYQELVRPKG